ncbi:hypothetical protein BMETH_78012011281921, partial [methanotrophic bacterial endosymbiont of Bathymodiolus sp.]
MQNQTESQRPGYGSLSAQSEGFFSVTF